MAYENYRFVNWGSYTPITSARLGQMSTNTEQVKEATSNLPKGILKYKLVTSPVVLSNYDTKNVISFLEDEGIVDNRMTVEANRYVRVTIQLPGIKLNDEGAENCRYDLILYENAQGDNSTPVINTWYLNPHISQYYAVHTGSTVETQTTGSHPVWFGAGVYSVVLDSSSGWNNKSLHFGITRKANANMANAPGFTVQAAVTQAIEFYVEDIGAKV